jgi:S1-C subfamily serine protease
VLAGVFGAALLQLAFLSPVAAQLDEGVLSRVEWSTVRVSAGGSVCSGVIVTSAGHVFTASHGVPEDAGAVRLLLADGREVSARVLVRDADADAVLLAIESSEAVAEYTWLALGQGESGGVDVSDIVLSAGYPAREAAGRSTVFRLGRVIAAGDVLVRTSCVLTVGDSGGALVNRLGELIGIHRQIGASSDLNEHVGLRHLRGLLLRAGVEVVSGTPDGASLWPSELRFGLSDAVLREAAKLTVELLSGEEATEALVLGVRVDERLTVTKLSELRPGAGVFGRFCDGVVRRMRVVKQDVEADVGWLECEGAADLPALGKLVRAEPCRGDVVYGVLGFAADGSVCRVSGPGLITRTAHTEPRAAARLGMILEAVAGESGLRVRETAPNGPAAIAGFRTGDVLLRCGGEPIAGLAMLGERLERVQPGDWLEFELLRGGQRMLVPLRCGHDVGAVFDRREYLDGRAGVLSERRTGFSGVFQHDVPARPVECGGVLISQNGRVVGWNIARRSRESTLARGW